jgi:uncharacterized membrane protein
MRTPTRHGHRRGDRCRHRGDDRRGGRRRLMKDLGEKLKPGNAAVFVLVRQSTPDKVLPRISQYGGDVIHSSLSEEAEETLREALREKQPA